MKNTLILFLLLTVLTGYTQSVNDNYIDDKIYCRVSFEIQQDVRISDMKFIEEIKDVYKIYKIDIPFYNTSNSGLKKTLRIWFERKDKLDELVRLLNKNPDVIFAEKIPLDKIAMSPNDEYYGANYGGYNWNWHFDQINASLAWNYSTGSEVVKVAIVDNAIYWEHPEFSGRIIARHDAANNDNDPAPETINYTWSHGTHAMGLIGAGLNNNIGIASMGGNISLIPVRAANSSGYLTASYEGVQWAVNAGADIINMSFGSTSFSQTNQEIMNWAYNEGIVLVAAGGNDDNESPYYPAAYENVIGVAAVNGDNTKYGLSSYGSWINISAPGGGHVQDGLPLFSTVAHDASDSPSGDLTEMFGVSGKYDLMRGTSMAAPMVSGLCALIKSKEPQITVDQLKTCLYATASNIESNNPEYEGKLGVGRINAGMALFCADTITISTSHIDNQINTNLSVYVSEGNLYVESSEIIQTISIINLQGQKLIQKNVNSNNYKFNLNMLNSNVLLVKVQINNQMFVKKVFVK